MLNVNEYIVVKDALSLKANKKMIQHKIQRETGKKTTLKDLSNIRQGCKNLNGNEIETLLSI